MGIPRFIGSKDLAQQMSLSPDSVERWAKRLGVPPTIPGHASHRWSEEDALKLLSRWQEYWTKKRNDPTYERRNEPPPGEPTLKPTHSPHKPTLRPPGVTHVRPHPSPCR
jgi:hypothetical protein